MSRFDELEARIAQLEAQRSAHEDDIQTLEKRLDFETLLSDLSSAFVNLPDGSVNSEIENWLHRIVVSLGVERCTVAAVTDDRSFSVLYSWSAPGFQAVSIHNTRADCPWCEEKILRGETVALASLDELPPVAEIDRRSLESLGTKSCLILPMMVGGSVHGMLAFGMLSRERAWRDEQQTRLELIAQVFANALERKKSQMALRYRIEFENLLSEVSARFINIDLQDIEIEIERSLKRIARFAGTDSGYVNLFFDENRQFRMNYLWQNQHGVFRKEELDNLKVSDFPWVVDNVLLGGSPSVVSSINDLPEEASREKGFFESLGVKSLIDVPMVQRGKVIGFTGFACTMKQRTWADDEVSLLKMVGQIFTNAIERTKTGTELRDYDQRIRDIVEASRDWVWSAGIDGVHSYSSPAIASILGYTPEEIKGRNVFDLMHPDDMQAIRTTLATCIKERRGWSNLLVRWRHKNGGWRFLESNAVPVLDADGQVTGFRGVDRDITLRKNAEDALQSGEKFLKDAFDAIQDGLSVLDPDLNVVRTNRWMERMYADRMPLVGRKCYDVYQKRKSECSWCPAIRTIETGEVNSEIVPYPSEENRTGWIELSAFPIKDENGRVTQVIEYVKDITDRRKTEEELRESEEHLRAVFRAAPTGVGVVIDRVIQQVNDRLSAMVGYSEEELVGQNSRLLYPDNDEFEYVGREKYRQITESGTGTVETRWQRKDGRIIDVLLSSTPLDFEDLSKGVTFTALDITDRKRAENDLKASERKSLEQQAYLETIYNGVNHPIFVVDVAENGEFLYEGSNAVHRAALRMSASELRGKTPMDLVPIISEETAKTVVANYQRCSEAGEVIEYEEKLEIDHQVLWVLTRLTPLKNDEGRVYRIIGSSTDFTARKLAEEGVKERLEFEALLAELSSSFLNLPAVQVDTEISRWLERLGMYMGVDACLVWEPKGEEITYQSTHIWRASGFPPLTQIDSIEFPWGAKRMLMGKPDAVSRINDLPSEAAEDIESHRRYGTKSFMSIPLIVGDLRPLGVISFVALRAERDWPEEVVQRGQLIAEVIANALARRDADQELQSALTEIGALKEKLEAENIYLQEEIRLEHDFGEIVGRSKGLKESLMKVEQVAASDATVLVLGETGTGKELIARAVHALSARRDRPLVKVNCAALPSTLIESDLFGHVKGAFTGAMARKTGRFELSDGGTIFLDEIGDLPSDMQTKLLRVLQEGEFERVGDPTTIKVDVRVIAATNRNLAEAVKSGKFREDLYYRLNVFPIEVPPLRERKEDIPLLAKFFVAKFNKKIGKQIEKIPKSVLTELQSYDWPGNVRGLENVIERSMIMSRGDQLELGDWLRRESPSQPKDKPRTLEEVERDHIIETLKLTEWRVSGDRGAAKILGMNPKTLESRMKKLGISRPK